MKSTWIFLTLIVAVAAFAFGQQQLPEGEGKQLIENRCGSCHGLDSVFSHKASRDEWQKIVVRMVGYGAQLADKEVDTAVEYLTRNFATPTSGDSQDEKIARRFIDGICSSCHNSDFIKETEGTKDEWVEIVKRMNGKGAGLSERDVELLADYLAKNYGPKNGRS